MKTSMPFLLLVMLAGLVACRKIDSKTPVPPQAQPPKTVTKPKSDIPKYGPLTEERIQQRILDDRRDSLRIDLALKDALKVARPNLKADTLEMHYVFQPDDSSFEIDVDILIGDLFQDNRKYLYCRRRMPSAAYMDVYRIKGGKPHRVVDTDQRENTFVEDTIFDVNGDGFKDFVVNWYPASGCCLRDISRVYLNLPDKGRFTSEYEFMNPKFSPEEKVIRGHEYGYPDVAGFYKYRWNGLQVDTIEYIYTSQRIEGKYIKTKRSKWSQYPPEGVILDEVPAEYYE